MKFGDYFAFFFLSNGGVMNDVVYQWLDPVIKLSVLCVFFHIN